MYIENTSSEANNSEMSHVTPASKRQRDIILEEGAEESSTKIVAISKTGEGPKKKVQNVKKESQ